MEFYGLVRDGPRNLFSQRARPKRQRMKEEEEEGEKVEGEKCTNHTPLPKGGRILVLASGTGYTQSRRSLQEEGDGGE